MKNSDPEKKSIRIITAVTANTHDVPRQINRPLSEHSTQARTDGLETTQLATVEEKRARRRKIWIGWS